MIRVLFFIFTFFAVYAPSLCAAGSSIGVVDVLQILDHSKAAQSIQRQREDMRAKFLDEISKIEQDLREEEKALLEQRGTLSPEDYAQKRQDYEAELLVVRKKAQEKKRLLEEASSRAMDALREQLYMVVQAIAKERGFELVISNKNVIAGEKSLDITDETMKRLNEAVADIPLTLKGE